MLNDAPLASPYTSRELVCGGYVAATMWAFSATLLVVLTAWSLSPLWFA